MAADFVSRISGLHLCIVQVCMDFNCAVVSSPTHEECRRSRGRGTMVFSGAVCLIPGIGCEHKSESKKSLLDPDHVCLDDTEGLVDSVATSALQRTFKGNSERLQGHQSCKMFRDRRWPIARYRV
eukprot:1142943-Pelagomonas_calceolata.AAC.3